MGDCDCVTINSRTQCPTLHGNARSEERRRREEERATNNYVQGYKCFQGKKELWIRLHKMLSTYFIREFYKITEKDEMVLYEESKIIIFLSL